jgi:FixJ family two-component response regulator
MSTIAITATKPVTIDTFVEAVNTEAVKFHTVRSNGTTRRVRVLTAEEREVANWVQAQREEGMTMKEIAKEMSLSVPSVRRLINRALLTEEVLEGDVEEQEEWVALAATVAPQGPLKEDGSF